MRIRQNLGQRPRRHQFPAAHAGAGAEVDEVIRLAHRILVVLDHDHGIPDVTQMAERIEQAIIVALVQADAGFIKNVEDADEARADLRGEPDALRFTAAERAALAVQREIAQPDIVEKTQARTNLLQRFRRDLRLHLRQSKTGEKDIRLVHGQRAEIHDGEAGDLQTRIADCGLRNSYSRFHIPHSAFRIQSDRQHLGLEPLAVARVAVSRIHERLEPVAREFTLALRVEPLQVRHHALERPLGYAHLPRAPEIEINLLLAGAMQKFLPKILRQILERRLQAHAVVRGHAAQQTLVINDHPLAAAPPGQHRAAVEALRVIRHDERFVEDHLLSETVADGAGSGGRIEGKMLRRQRLETLPRARTVAAIRVQRLGPLAGVRRVAGLREQQQLSIAPLQRHLDGIAEAHANLVVDDQAIHHHVDVVARLGIELHPDVGLKLD